MAKDFKIKKATPNLLSFGQTIQIANQRKENPRLAFSFENLPEEEK